MEGVQEQVTSLKLLVPEDIEILFFDVGKCEQRGILQPSGLNDHLYEVADAQYRRQPAFISNYIQHSLQKKQHDCIHNTS